MMLYFLLWTTVLLLLVGVRNAVTTRRQLLITSAVILGFACGQGSWSSTAYPFIRWSMYSLPQTPKEYFRFIVFDTSGTSEDYPFHALTPMAPGPLSGFVTLSPLAMRLVVAQRRCRCHSNDPEIDRLIYGLNSFYAAHSTKKFVRLEILAVSIDGLSHSSASVIYRWEKLG